MLGTKTKSNKIAEKKHHNGLNGLNDSGETCVISHGTMIDGKFKATENVRVDGIIKGEVKCEKRLVMGEKGRIEGTISSKDAIIMGKIEGELHVTGTLTLKGTALIKGIINAKYMIVDEGAKYYGECNIG